MNHKSASLRLFSTLLILSFLIGCRSPKPSLTATPPGATLAPSTQGTLPSVNETTLADIVLAAGKVAPAPVSDVAQQQPPQVSPDGKTETISETHTKTENFDNIMYLGLNDDIIWPGNLVKGDQVNNFVYEPIQVARGPITLSISLENSISAGPSLSAQVNDPKLSTVRQGISDLLKKAVTPETRVPAKVEFSYQRVYNQSQLNLSLGTDIKYGAGNLNAKFNWDSTSKKNKIVAVYKQIYYSIDIDVPTAPVDFFAPTVTADQLAAAMPAGSDPIFIAGVNYGMMALIFIETDSSEEDITAALDAGYSGGAEVKINGNLTAKDILENSSIKIVVYGGSTANLKNLETGYDGFKKVIEASSDFNQDTPGVPLLYKFRHLTDDTLALASLTSQYTTTRTIQLAQTVKVKLVSITCTWNNDGFPWGKTKIQKIQFGMNAYNVKPDGSFGTIDLARPDKISIGGGDVSEIYSTINERNWQPATNDILNTGKPSVLITFNTDPALDYKNAYIILKGYMTTDRAYAKFYPEAEISISFADFLEDEGIHDLVIDGADATIDIKFSIELVQ